MALLVTGSIGIDTVATPHGRAEAVLGGSAVYFAFAASHFSPVRLVAAVGEDFPEEFHDILRARDLHLDGLEKRPGSKTFRWQGKYEGAMNEAETVAVDLNVLAEQAPNVPEIWSDTETIFLANTHPTLQRELLSQVPNANLSVMDTMNLWIDNERESLLETIGQVGGVIINDQEARTLTGKVNLIEAGESLLDRGPVFVIIKKGEHGSMLVTREGAVSVPAFSTKDVRDPTGAGDSFAGGVLGFLAAEGVHDHETLRRSMIRGTVTASFAIEDFSLNRVKDLKREEIDRRVEEFKRMLRFE